LSPLHLEQKKTALVLIDLQNGVVAVPTAPHTAAEVVQKSRLLAQAFRAKGAPVIYVRVDIGNLVQLPVDVSHRDPNAPPPSHQRLHLKLAFWPVTC
jgi:nicotinamidase-related amidase